MKLKFLKEVELTVPHELHIHTRMQTYREQGPSGMLHPTLLPHLSVIRYCKCSLAQSPQ